MIRKKSIQLINQFPKGSNQNVFDDLQTSLSLAKLPAVNDPAWRTFNYGVGSGVAFAALGFALDDYIDFFLQTQHSMKLNTDLDCHIHYTLPTDSADTKIKFKLDVVAAGINSDYAVPTGSPYSKEYTLVGDESGKHNYLDICDIATFNTTLSSIAVCRLTRIAASSADYAGEVYVTFIDCHFRKDTVGSRQETTK